MRDGNGNFQLPPGNPVVTGTVVSSNDFNTTMADLRDGLTESIAKDGQTVPTANLPMGRNKHTNCANASVRGEYATLANVQDNVTHYLGVVTGDANNMHGNTTPIFSPLVNGQLFTFRKNAETNTSTVTLTVNGTSPLPVLRSNQNAMSPGELPANCFCIVQYTFGVFVLFNEPVGWSQIDPVNAATLGGVPAANYARVDISNSFAQNQGFSGDVFISPGKYLYVTTSPAGDNATRAATTQFVQDALMARIGDIRGYPMLFHANVAPVGWVRYTAAYDNYALRINNSSDMSSGGSIPFTTAFAMRSSELTALSIAQMPPHDHSYTGPGAPTLVWGSGGFSNPTGTQAGTTGQTGGGAGHGHNMNLAVAYVDFMMAIKSS